MEYKLRNTGVTEKALKRTVLHRIRSVHTWHLLDNKMVSRVCLQRHPLDVHCSEVVHEAAWLYMENKRRRRKEVKTWTCPTLACHPIRTRLLKLTSLAGATFLLILHVSAWIFETVTTVIFITDFHSMSLNYSSPNLTVSDQTKTVDLHFSLMIFFFIFYLLFLLYSNSWRYVGMIFQSSSSHGLQSEEDSTDSLDRLSRR